MTPGPNATFLKVDHVSAAVNKIEIDILFTAKDLATQAYYSNNTKVGYSLEFSIDDQDLKVNTNWSTPVVEHDI